MASPRRTRAIGGFSALLAGTVLAALLSGAAYADPSSDPNAPAVLPAPSAAPAAPTNASDALKQLQAAQQDAASLTEQWHAAQDTLTLKTADADRARTAVPPAQAAVTAAKAAEESFRTQYSDGITGAAFESGQLDQLTALLTSHDPQEYLDQMSALESFTGENKIALDKLLDVVTTTQNAQTNAAQVVGTAQQAAQDARAAADEIGVRKKAAEVRINEVETLLEKLSPADRAARRGPTIIGPLGPLVGRGAGIAALNAAITRMNSPYVWGAQGPGTFDCSGLTFWAYKQVGITLPRSSIAQSSVGTAVAESALQPGDLVFFYSPVHHVGIYVGSGKVLNAVQTGDVVRYSDIDGMPFHNARRI